MSILKGFPDITRAAMPLVHPCAWHGALAELLAIAGSHKTPAVTGRKGNADKARAVSRNGASEGSMRQNLCP
jgi:hypothetical protein